MKGTFLFIGGPADGQRIETDGGQYRNILKLNRHYFTEAPSPREIAGEEHTYEAHRFRDRHGKDFIIYEHVSSKEVSVVASMIESYVAKDDPIRKFAKLADLIMKGATFNAIMEEVLRVESEILHALPRVT